MKRDCFIKLHGREMGDDENAVEIITVGQYSKKNGKHIITYDEELSSGITHTTLEIDGENVNLTRAGETNSHLSFVRGEKRVGYYETPAGCFSIGVTTDALAVALAEDDGEINIDYLLDINNVHKARHKLQMSVLFNNDNILSFGQN